MSKLFYIFKISLIIIACLILLILLYLFAAYSLSLVVVKEKPVSEEKNIEVYILSNGMHTDIVVPVKNDMIDWSELFKYEHTNNADSSFKYLAIGWGDKAFYLEIPEWSDLTVSIALKAGLGMSSSAIHSTFYRYIYEDDSCKKLLLTDKQYKALIDYVLNFLEFDKNNCPINIKTDALYGNYDSFYEAKKSYNIFFTCNTWTNNLLKACEQRACLWTPFTWGILNLYKY